MHEIGVRMGEILSLLHKNGIYYNDNTLYRDDLFISDSERSASPMRRMPRTFTISPAVKPMSWPFGTVPDSGRPTTGWP